jgi:hypothetical protein
MTVIGQDALATLEAVPPPVTGSATNAGAPAALCKRSAASLDLAHKPPTLLLNRNIFPGHDALEKC